LLFDCQTKVEKNFHVVINNRKSENTMNAIGLGTAAGGLLPFLFPNILHSIFHLFFLFFRFNPLVAEPCVCPA